MGSNKKGYIDYSNDHNPIFRVVVDGYEYGFSVAGFKKDRHEWLLGVLDRMVWELVKRNTLTVKKELKYNFDHLFD